MKQITILFLISFFISNVVVSQQSEEEMFIKSDSALISGTLLLPENDFNNIVIIVAGSGATDRNGNNFSANLNTNTYKLIAENLCLKDIATFRFDKRGVGKSTNTTFKEEAIIIDVFIKDIVAIADIFRNQFEGKNIILLGHSEGALLVLMAAQQIAVDAVISVSGTSEPIDKTITEQLKKTLSDSTLQIANEIFEKIKKNVEIEETPQILNALFRPSVIPYLRSWMALNPVEEIKKVKTSLLIIQGVCDIQVKPQNAINLQKASNSATLLMIENMGHTLKKTEANCGNDFLTYSNPKYPLHPEFITGVVSFINSLD